MFPTTPMPTTQLATLTPEKAPDRHPDAGKIRVLTLRASADADLGNEALAFYLRPMADLLIGNTSRSIKLEQSDAGSSCSMVVAVMEPTKETMDVPDVDVAVDVEAPEVEAGKDETAERAEQVARETRILTRLDSLRHVLLDVLGPLKQRVSPVDHSDIFEALAAANERIGQCQQLVSAIAADIRP